MFKEIDKRKTLKEHLEILNHREAVFYVEAIVKNEEELTEWQIENIHSLILKGIDDKYKIIKFELISFQARSFLNSSLFIPFLEA